jgi:hypothetical protein
VFSGYFEFQTMDKVHIPHDSEFGNSSTVSLWNLRLRSFFNICQKSHGVTLVTKELAVASWHCSLILPFSPGNFLPKQLYCHPPPTILYSVSLIEDKTEGPQFFTQLRWERQNRRRCWTPHRTRLPRCIWKMAEALGTVNTCRMILLQGLQWPVGPKLVS